MTALTGGYHAAFLVGALFAAAAAGLGAVLLRGGAGSSAGGHGEAQDRQHEPLATSA